MPGRPLPESIRPFVAEAPVHRSAIARFVLETADAAPPGSRVLDAGAGKAPYRPLFGHCDYRAADWPQSVHGERPPEILADLHELPVEDHSFDLVLCTEVLEHVAEPAVVLAELRRVLAPGGRLAVTVPMVGELHEEPFDFYRYTGYGVGRLAEAAGFRVEAVIPLTGYYSTLSHVLRHAGLATRGRRPGLVQRAVAFALLGLSVLLAAAAPLLDRLDSRRSLPIGWACRAVRAD